MKKKNLILPLAVCAALAAAACSPAESSSAGSAASSESAVVSESVSFSSENTAVESTSVSSENTAAESASAPENASVSSESTASAETVIGNTTYHSIDPSVFGEMLEEETDSEAIIPEDLKVNASAASPNGGFSLDDLKTDFTVFGSDDRLFVSGEDTLTYPLSTVAKIIPECPGGDYTEATGVLIGDNCLLTSFSSIYCPNHQELCELTVAFGVQEDGTALYVAEGILDIYYSSYYPLSISSEEDEVARLENDWCLIYFEDEKPGEYLGTLKASCLSDSKLEKVKTLVLLAYDGPELCAAAGTISEYDDFFITYDCDTDWGSFGGPIINDDTLEVIAINVAEGSRANVGLRYSKDIKNAKKEVDKNYK